MSIFSSMRYCLGSPNDFSNMWAALAFMPFGLFFDFMDGKVARWRGKSSLMGQELDSLADLVCSYFHPTLLACCRRTCLPDRTIFNSFNHRSPSAPLQHLPRSPWAFAPLSTISSSHSSYFPALCAWPDSTSQCQPYQKMPLASQSTSKAPQSLHHYRYQHSWHSG